MRHPKIAVRCFFQAHARASSASRVREGTGISCVCYNPCAYAHGSNGKNNLTGRVFKQTRGVRF